MRLRAGRRGKAVSSELNVLREDPPARGRAPLIILLGMILLYAGGFSFYTVVKHLTFSSQAYDLGTFDQGIWLAGHTTDPFVTVRGLHLLGDHVRLFSYVLAPIYYIWDDVRLLLILQSVVIALGALGLFLVARRELPGNPFAVLLLCAGYLLNPAVQNLNLDHAHPEAFASTFIIFCFYFLVTKRMVLFSTFMVLAMLCKEDVPLVFLFLGIVAAVRGERKKGAVISSAAALYLVLCFLVILPHFNGVGFFRTEIGHYGSVKNNLLEPSWYLDRLLDPANRVYLFQVGLPVAFLCVFSPLLLLPALPALLINMLGHSPYMRSINYHYTTSIVPFLYLGTIVTLRKCLDRDRPRWLPIPGFVSDRNGGDLLLVAIRKWTIPRRILVVAVTGLFLVCAIASNVGYSKLPVNRLGKIQKRYHQYRTDPGVRSLHELIARVPEDAAVSADYTVVPHLSHRRGIYMFPNPFVPNYWGIREENPHDPSVIDTILVRESVVKPEKWVVVDSLLERGAFRLEAHEGTARLYTRGPDEETPGVRTDSETGGLLGRFYQFPHGFTKLPTQVENRWPIFEAVFPEIEFPLTKREFKSRDGVDTRLLKQFLAVFEGEFYAERAGDYVFQVKSDDGFRLLLNDEVVAEFPKHRAFKTTGGKVALTRGWHSIELIYFNNNPPAGLVLSVRPPGGKLSPVSREHLRPPGSDK